MQLNGTISSIDSTGGYDGQNGHIFTYGMTINTPDGQYITGEIGSKSNPYPAKVGSQIIVESNTGQHGTKFKKVNPQYQNQGQPPQQPQGQQQPQQQRPAQQPQHQQQPLKGPDATGKLIIAQVAAKLVAELIVGGQFVSNGTANTQSAVKEWYDIIIAVGTGQAPAIQQQQQSQVPNQYPDQQSQVPQQDNFSDDGSGIPF